MSFPNTRPKRTLRQELLVLLLIAGVTGASFLFFPFEALVAAPRFAAKPAVGCSLVELSEQRYQEAVASSRTAISRSNGEYAVGRLDLSEDVPAETADSPVADIGERARPRRHDSRAYDHILPRLTIGGEVVASAPQIPPAQTASPAFSKAQLLDASILPYKIPTRESL